MKAIWGMKIKKACISIRFDTSNVDQTFSKIRHGSHAIISSENTHWGTRWFVVEDPDGNQFGWQALPKNRPNKTTAH